MSLSALDLGRSVTSNGAAVDGPERIRTYDARVSPELAAAHAAVDEAVKILRDGRARPHKRIGKAAKDFLTEVDLASESAMQRSLAASTPTIGFYGEEGGGAALGSGRVWVADPLDGTINYATGSPLCGVMLGLLEDGVPTLGVIDLPFLGVRVDSGAVADVDALDEGIIGMGDAFHRGGARLDAYLELTAIMQRHFAARNWAEWKPILIAQGLIYSEIQTLEDLPDDPQVAANDIFVPTGDPQLPRTVANPINASFAAKRQSGPAPELGQHSDEVLRWAGVSEEQIARLRAAGAIA